MNKKLRRILGVRERAPGDLITGTLNPGKNGGWVVSWAGEGSLPKTIESAGLTQAADEAAAVVATLYAGHAPVPGAELQLAIFPSRYRGGPIFDISGDTGAFTAHDLQGSDRTVTGATLEDLLEVVRKLDDMPEDDYMFRWVRPVASLPRPAEPAHG